MYNILWYFILYSFIGWCLEVVFCTINTRKLVNRGFLNGPLCPIYGFGAVIVIYTLQPISGNLLFLFVGSVILTSLLELVTGWLLKTLFHTSWWDYSKNRFNLGGYICLSFSLLWGAICVLLIKVIHPALSGLVGLLPQFIGIPLLVVLYAALLVDLIATVKVVTKLNRDLGRISELAEKLHDGSDAMADGLGNRALAFADKVDEWDLEGKRQALTDKLDDTKEKWQAGWEEEKEKLSAQMQHLLNRNKKSRRRLLRAFPNRKAQSNNNALEKLRERLGVGKNVTRIAKRDEEPQNHPHKEDTP